MSEKKKKRLGKAKLRNTNAIYSTTNEFKK